MPAVDCFRSWFPVWWSLDRNVILTEAFRSMMGCFASIKDWWTAWLLVNNAETHCVPLSGEPIRRGSMKVKIYRRPNMLEHVCSPALLDIKGCLEPDKYRNFRTNNIPVCQLIPTVILDTWFSDCVLVVCLVIYYLLLRSAGCCFSGAPTMVPSGTFQSGLWWINCAASTFITW